MTLLTSFEKQLAGYAEPLERALPRFLPDREGPHKQVAEAMAYSLLSGGKRVRAVLLLACHELFAGDFSPALPFAAAVEMVHAYSLIHDDLPCMDNDDTRRGKPSCHIAFGEAAALLAGDGLLTLAFETMARTENTESFGYEKTLGAVRILAKAAGADGMVGGQMLDLENEGRDVTLERLMLTDGKKTGALIAAACEMGCILGGAGEKATACVQNYAAKLGLAFQIRDDVLDVEGDPERLGKPVGSDSANNRATYASIYGVKRAAEVADRLTEEAVSAIENTGLDVGFLCGLARMLAGRKH